MSADYRFYLLEGDHIVAANVCVRAQRYYRNGAAYRLNRRRRKG